MGTLFEQKERSEWIGTYSYDIAKKVKELSYDYNITNEIAFKCIELGMKIDDWDRKDEQLEGFGLLFQDLNESIKKLKEDD